MSSGGNNSLRLPLITTAIAVAIAVAYIYYRNKKQREQGLQNVGQREGAIATIDYDNYDAGGDVAAPAETDSKEAEPPSYNPNKQKDNNNNRNNNNNNNSHDAKDDNKTDSYSYSRMKHSNDHMSGYYSASSEEDESTVKLFQDCDYKPSNTIDNYLNLISTAQTNQGILLKHLSNSNNGNESTEILDQTSFNQKLAIIQKKVLFSLFCLL